MSNAFNPLTFHDIIFRARVSLLRGGGLIVLGLYGIQLACGFLCASIVQGSESSSGLNPALGTGPWTVSNKQLGKGESNLSTEGVKISQQMCIPATVSFWTTVLLSLTLVTEISSRVVFLLDFCFVLLLFLLGVSEIISELSSFCSTTTEAPPFLFKGASKGLTSSTDDFPSSPAERKQACS